MSRSSDDKVFQAAGPDVENARGPNVDVSALGTTNWLSSADRSRLVVCLVVLCIPLWTSSNIADAALKYLHNG